VNISLVFEPPDQRARVFLVRITVVSRTRPHDVQ
jgi:hypothetical protein